MDWNALENAVAAQLGSSLSLERRRAVAGGCINESWIIDTGSGSLFLKLNRADAAPLFTAEWNGLVALREHCDLQVPEPLARGEDAGVSWLVLECVAWRPNTAASAAELGEGLAALHRHTASRHGFASDNFIGSTPQVNLPGSDWREFFRDHRLGYQLELARERGAPAELLHAVERVIAELPALLAQHVPAASLLHGDLWSGNWGTDARGRAVIFDPAVYYGDREADIAMTELFGSFPAAFYDAYNAAWPLPTGYSTRRTLYNLYHVLNHFNLFGGGYAGQAHRMCESLCPA